MTLVILSHFAATFFMVGVIWFIQVVHYPLYTQINPDSFPNYEVNHVNRITLVVGPVMFFEAITALLLVIAPPDGVSRWVTGAGLALVAVIWWATLFVNVSHHNALSYQFDAAVHRMLVLTNWIRTVAWSLRGGLALWILAQML